MDWVPGGVSDHRAGEVAAYRFGHVASAGQWQHYLAEARQNLVGGT
jgi:hypothetical protein